MTADDPAARIRAVREHIARERSKTPRVDHNGHPLPPDADDGTRPLTDPEQTAGGVEPTPPAAS